MYMHIALHIYYIIIIYNVYCNHNIIYCNITMILFYILLYVLYYIIYITVYIHISIFSLRKIELLAKNFSLFLPILNIYSCNKNLFLCYIYCITTVISDKICLMMCINDSIIIDMHIIKIISYFNIL